MKSSIRETGTRFASLALTLVIAFTFSACLSVRSDDASTQEFDPAIVSANTDGADNADDADDAATPSSPGASASAATDTSSSPSTSAAVTTPAVSGQSTSKTAVDHTDDNPEDAEAIKDKAPSAKKDKKKKTTKPDKSKTNNDDKTSESVQTQPDEEQQTEQTGDKITVAISVDCLTLYAENPEMAGQVSNEGVILEKKNVEVTSDANVYDVLKASGVAFAGKSYISSIGGLSEFDGGAKSGWVYLINGTYMSIGVTKYIVKSGDYVQFRYTLDSGADVK